MQVHGAPPRRKRLHWLLLASAACIYVTCSSQPELHPYRSPRPQPTYELASGARKTVRQMTAAERAAELPKLDRGCISCHLDSRDPHPGGPKMTCVGCHGGDAEATTIEQAHPRPRHEDAWRDSANPERSYALLNDESPEWIRFVNPGDLRVAPRTCGTAGCHADITLHVQKSLMTNSAHFWGAAAYCNGIVPTKRTIFGESYAEDGTSLRSNTVVAGAGGSRRAPTDAEVAEHSISPFLVPLPRFESTQPGNVYRVFERGSRLGTSGLGLNGTNAPVVGLPDKLEDPGRPNNRLSDRGLGTLNRVDLPLLNVHKTRLNDPLLSFLGTNDQPGDYRSSGCTACHMVYANDRDPVHSGPYARFGNGGLGNVGLALPTLEDDPARPFDPTIPTVAPGHPLQHVFTRSIPSSQCMVCHMHQPNSFLNTYYGFQMWSYETDGAPMWPKEEASPSNSEWFDRIDRNPEEAAVRGNWGDPEFLRNVPALNPQLEHTQFADYHGHGWIFRAVFKTDRHGNLLDRDGNVVRYDDPKKFEGVIPTLGDVDPRATAEQLRQRFEPKPGKPVHLMDIHAERGMHCVDCHYEPDVHGNGLLYSEYQAAIQVACEDCHGTTERPAALTPSGPASRGPGLPEPRNFRDDRTPWNQPRFAVSGGAVKQRSMLYENVEWTVPQVKNSVTVGHAEYNERAAFAKLQQDAAGRLAHAPAKMDCATCHTSWVTSCFGCHLPQKANWRSDLHHFEHGQLRNLASYNPQVARDDAFMLGIAPDVKDSIVDGKRIDRIGVVRSSSAIIISSEDAQRRIIYKQLPTVAGNGMSSQAFNTHFAHTVRTTETRTCADCHVSEAEDNNAWLAQVLLLGTGTVNFMGMHAYVGTGDGVEAVVVSEWDEPQAIVGSNLQRLAFPDRFADHVEDDRRLSTSVHHGGDEVLGVQLRGEYLFTACGSGGFRVYDVANVANKDFSEKIVTAPVSPFGQDTHVDTGFATCVALPTNNSISLSRTFRPENRETDYAYRGRSQNLHESYRYAYVTDRVEGLILVDVECLNDGDPDNNFLSRALTFNPDRILDGAVFAVVAGTQVYVCCDRGVVVVDVDDPLAPRVAGVVGSPAVTKPTSIAVQFRYAFVTDAEGLKVLDVTRPEAVAPVTQARVDLAGARHVYVARTWGYVSTPEGMVIVDLEKPASPRKVDVFTAEGRIADLHQVQIGAAYDSIYAFLADGRNGLHVVQLVTPEDGGRSAYGFAPTPRPKLIATFKTSSPALSLSRGLDRDRAVDESGHQVAVFGRIGGRPFDLAEMRRLYERADGSVYRVPASASPPKDWKPAPPPAR